MLKKESITVIAIGKKLHPLRKPKQTFLQLFLKSKFMKGVISGIPLFIL